MVMQVEEVGKNGDGVMVSDEWEVKAMNGKGGDV